MTSPLHFTDFPVRMLDSLSIVRLYENVMLYDIEKYGIFEEDVRTAIQSMAHVYKPDCVSLNSNRSVVADYNDPAHRCAYLHKYAALHTAMVRDMISEAINTDYDYFRDVLFSEDCFRICSLGGGPGSDVVGALAAFHLAYPHFNATATVVDYMSSWSFTFDSIMRELSTGWYGSFGVHASSVPWQYVGANLLKTPTPDVFEALSTASLVTMVKFASAAACQDTHNMMKNIFAALKPGALVLFIDNSGGGFHNIVQAAATEYHLFSVFGPIKHKGYINELTKIKKFGRMSCFKTTITVHMLQKPRNMCFRSPTRRVLLGPPLHLSPPTPMLFKHGDKFTKDQFINNPHFVSSPELPLTPNNVIVPSYIRTPLHSNIINSPLYSRPPNSPLYSRPPNSPLYSRPPMSSPDTQPRRKKKINRNGCLPFNYFRHRLAEKVENVRIKARSLFQNRRKAKKTHPIFEI